MKPVPLFLGNWKMHMLPEEATGFVSQFLELHTKAPSGYPDTGIAPPYVSIPAVAQHYPDRDGVLLGAQNVHWDSSGAHTGEISCEMLISLGVNFVIVGHSERRMLYGETDIDVAKRAKAAVEHNLLTVACIGETEAQFRAGETNTVVQRQPEDVLAAIPQECVNQFAVAYEPVWAIGTGLAATPEQARTVHGIIRERLVERFDKAEGDSIRILYGGSTKPENIAALMSQPNVQGALVGGASLKPEVFNALIENGRKAYWAD